MFHQESMFEILLSSLLLAVVRRKRLVSLASIMEFLGLGVNGKIELF